MSWLSGQAELGGGLHDLFEQSTADVRVAKVYTRITRHEGQRAAMSLLVPCAVWGTVRL